MTIKPSSSGYRALGKKTRRALWLAVALCLLPHIALVASTLIFIALSRAMGQVTRGLWLEPTVGVGMIIALTLIHFLIKASGRVGFLAIEYPSPGAFRVRGLADSVSWNE